MWTIFRSVDLAEQVRRSRTRSKINGVNRQHCLVTRGWGFATLCPLVREFPVLCPAATHQHLLIPVIIYGSFCPSWIRSVILDITKRHLKCNVIDDAAALHLLNRRSTARRPCRSLLRLLHRPVVSHSATADLVPVSRMSRGISRGIGLDLRLLQWVGIVRLEDFCLMISR